MLNDQILNAPMLQIYSCIISLLKDVMLNVVANGCIYRIFKASCDVAVIDGPDSNMRDERWRWKNQGRCSLDQGKHSKWMKE